MARVIAWLGPANIGVSPSIHWEVLVKYPTGMPVRGFLDVLWYDYDADPTEIYLWELKQSESSDYPNWDTQLAGYERALRAVVPRRHAVSRGTALAGFVDAWLVPIEPDASCPYTLFEAYVGWQSAAGLYETYRYEPTCFDERKEEVSQPVKIPKGAPAPPKGMAKPYPGHDYADVREDVPIVVLPMVCVDEPWTWCRFDRNLDEKMNEIKDFVASASRDPHLATFDGLKYSIQSVGEFIAAQSDPLSLQVQVRFVPFHGSDVASYVGATAFDLEGRRIEVRTDDPVELLIDGEPFALPDHHAADLGHGAAVIHSGQSYVALWPGTGPRPVLLAKHRALQLYVPPGTDVEGLFGDSDGNPENDLRTAFGEEMGERPSLAALHGGFADSWRITSDESMFTYAPGESTKTFTDRHFPKELVTVADLGTAERDAAVKQCEAVGVLDGPQFDECVLDAALTLDRSFVEAAAQMTRNVRVAGAATLDESGALEQTFEGGAAPNFWPPRFSNERGLGTFAGPFGKDGRYTFHVPGLPAHDEVTVAFDFLAIGKWTADASPRHVNVVANAAKVLSVAIHDQRPIAKGKLASGFPYAKYRLTATFPHGVDQLNAAVLVSGMSGAAEQAYGIDNVRVSVRRVLPQGFDVSLPLSTSTAPAGAGNLETASARDEYRFSISAATRLQLDFSACANGLASIRWTLVGDRTADPAATGRGCISTATPVLPAGRYRLEVSVGNGEQGTYTLLVSEPPAAQVAEVKLPTTLTTDKPPGAGRLETTSSVDGVRFAMPAAADLQLDFSQCSAGLHSIGWELRHQVDAVVAASGQGCWSAVVPNVQAGAYELRVHAEGTVGTYALSLLSRPADDVFAVALPATIAKGVPNTGAGTLETTASVDEYRFVLAAETRLTLQFSACSPGLASLQWKLVNDGDRPVATGRGCDEDLTPPLAAGTYRLAVQHNGHAGTYGLAISARPPADVFALALPTSISNGAPGKGAGNLETKASEDAYDFALASPTALRLAFSGCSSTLGWVKWELTPSGTAQPIRSGTGCEATTTHELPAGKYRLSVTRTGRTGTYSLGVGPAAP